MLRTLSAVLIYMLWAASVQAIEIRIDAPAEGVSLFDRVEVQVTVRPPEDIDRLELYLDSVLRGTLREPPFHFELDVGPDNKERWLEVVAYDHHGAAFRRRQLAPRLDVHESVDLDLQQIYVTVTDRRGNPVRHLQRADFKLSDAGERQELVTVAGGDIPFTAVLLIDGSWSMQGQPLRAAIRGGKEFVAAMQPLDEARLVVHSDRLLAMTPWQLGGSVGGEILSDVQATGGTAVMDFLFMALTQLEGRLGRRVVILLSDGWDLHSAVHPEDLQRLARLSQAIVFWVQPSAELAQQPGQTVARGPSRAVPLSHWRKRQTSHRIFSTLKQIVQQSGGRVVPIDTLDEASQAFETILEELRAQYALGYYPTPRHGDGRWRPVKVRLGTSGLKVRTRLGYVDR